jgi:hypothetical protein
VNDAFTGWFRLPDQLWQPVVTTDDENAAWRRLRLHVDRLNAKVIDLYVGPSDIDPRGGRRAVMQRRMF